jgi:hypothetical protein
MFRSTIRPISLPENRIPGACFITRRISFSISDQAHQGASPMTSPKRPCVGVRAHLEIATAGPRTVPVRSSKAGGKAQECFRPPRPSDVLRARAARAPVGVSRCASGVPTTVYLEPVPGAGFGKSLSETLSKMAASRQSSRQIDELEMATKRHKRRRRIQFL